MSLATLTYPWQWRAWRFYGSDLLWSYAGGGGQGQGIPSAPMLTGPKINNGAVGEVRYTLGWVAMQVGRVGWNVTIDGMPVAEDQRDELIAQVANQDTSVQIATNLIVAGELTYAAFDKEMLLEDGDGPLSYVSAAVFSAGPALPTSGDKVWVPISTIFPNRPSVLGAAALKVRGVWPHPANPGMPDPPLRGVLDVLEELEQLTDVAWAQNNSRLAQMGILEVAKQYSFVGANEGSEFQNDLQLAIDARLKDPRQTGATPIVLVVDETLVGKGLAYTRFDPDPDGQLEGKMKFAIQRLAWGFPVPPEILFGMTSTNRATAYQIEESTYEANIEPIAQLVGRIYAAALAKILANSNGDEPRVVFEPDATELLSRKHSVPDLQWAYVNGLVSGDAVLEAMGLDPKDPAVRAQLADLERIKALRDPAPGAGAAGTGTGTTEQPTAPDAAEQAGVGGISAAAGFGESRFTMPMLEVAQPDVDLDSMVRQLADVDTHLFQSLITAAGRDAEQALSKLGAQLRTKTRGNPEQRSEYANVANLRLPFKAGLDAFDAAGVDVRASLVQSFTPLVMWWRDTALADARVLVTAELARVGSVLPPDNGAFDRSANLLLDGLVDWATKQVKEQEYPYEEVPVELLRETINVAGAG